MAKPFPFCYCKQFYLSCVPVAFRDVTKTFILRVELQILITQCR